MILIERLHGWCNQENTLGRIFIDQQELNLLGRAYHELIAKDHFNLRADGTGWQKVDNIIERPYFIDSCRSNHMQLADILAYNLYHKYTYAGAYPYFNKILRKVRGNQRPDGGYFGLKVYP